MEDGSSSRSEGSGSSPERYLSDYEDDTLEGESRDEEERRRMRGVRRGSEGWEVRPARAGWNGWDGEVIERRRAWEEEGRYNIYDPDGGSDSEGDWADLGGSSALMANDDTLRSSTLT
jgi:hypothetical protein